MGQRDNRARPWLRLSLPLRTGARIKSFTCYVRKDAASTSSDVRPVSGAFSGVTLTSGDAFLESRSSVAVNLR